MAKAKQEPSDAPAKGGRPSDFNIWIAHEICALIAEGQSLRSICEIDFMPGRRTVLDWLDDDNHEGFRTKYARAREAQGDAMDDKILAVAEACTVESAPADRVKIDAYKWRASKLAPKKYGDKLAIGGDPTSPLNVVTEIRRVIVRPAD